MTARRTFAEQRAWYTEHVSAQKRGAVRERSMLKRLGMFFDAYALADIDRELVAEWRSERLEDVTAATVNREQEILNHLLNLSVPKYLEANPIGRMPRLKTRDVETRILTVDDETRLLKAAAGDPLATALILCGLDALMRRGSVATLARAQDHGRYLTLLNAKAGTYKVPVSTRLRKALDRLTPDPDGRYIPLAHKDITFRFEALCAEAKVTTGRAAGGVTFHSLRHTGASRMLAAGVDIKTVMRIGGWKNLVILQRYLHPTDEAAIAAVEAIASRSVRTTHGQSGKGRAKRPGSTGRSRK
jgi:integrase